MLEDGVMLLIFCCLEGLVLAAIFYFALLLAKKIFSPIPSDPHEVMLYLLIGFFTALAIFYPFNFIIGV